MEKLSLEKQQFCKEVCDYCALDASSVELPKMQVKTKGSEKYAVLYKPYNDGKNVFSYILYSQNENNKIAFVCTQKEKQPALGVMAMPDIDSQTLSLIKNGRRVWCKTQENPVQAKVSMLRAFMGDLSLSTKVTDEDKIILMQTVVEGIKLVSKSRRAEELTAKLVLGAELNKVSKGQALLDAVIKKHIIVGRCK